MKTTHVCAILLPAIVAISSAQAVTIEMVPVGNPGNPPDTEVMVTDGTSGYGSVSYAFQMSAKEVTNAQYVQFLNGVDPTGLNTLDLYNGNMSSDARGGINLNGGAANGFKYEIKPGRDNNPVVYVSWFDSIRFANWLHNGQGSGDTENGAYTLLGNTPLPSNWETINRNPGAKWWLPSENEWYKAAYHKNDGVTGNYSDYPTATDAIPFSDQPPGLGSPNQTNAANFNKDDGLPNGYDDGYAVTGSTTFVNSTNYLTEIGAYTSAKSWYSTFDQGGNVWEWNEPLLSSSRRGIRGGSWDNDYLAMRAAYRIGTAPGDQFNGVGFRVASTPEPSSLLLAGIGSVGLLPRRRR